MEINQVTLSNFILNTIFNKSHHRLKYLIDEGHGIDQQLCVYTILLMQDLHSIGPWLAAWKSQINS